MTEAFHLDRLNIAEQCFTKIGFHWRRIWSRKRASDQVKIENRTRKRSHKLDGIGVGRIRTVPFSVYDSEAYDPVKTSFTESEAEV